MRKHLNQHLFSPLSWLLVVFIVLLLAMVLLFLTPLGPRTAAQIASFTVKPLSLKGVSGSLLTGVHVDKFSWDAGTGIVLDNIDLKLQKYDFEKGKIYADHVTADRLSINLGKTKEDSNDAVVIPDFGLPLNIDAKVVSLKSLRITKKLNLEDQDQDQEQEAESTTTSPTKSKSASKPETKSEENLKTLFEIGDLQLEKLLINDHKLHFARLQGNPIILDAPLKINVTDGHLNMDQPHDLHTSGTLSFKHADLGQAAGDIDLKGTLTHYEFISDLDIRQQQIGDQKLKLAGKGDYKQVQFDSVDLQGGDGTLTGKANVFWSPDIKWSFNGEGKAINTQRWTPEWPATADAKVEYSGSYLANAQGEKSLKNNVEIIALNGKLKGTAFKAKGNLSSEGKQISSKGLDLQLGGNKVKVSGLASEPFDLAVKIDAPNLKQLAPVLTGLDLPDLKLAGQLKGSGSIKGTLKKPQIKVSLRADKLVYQEYRQGQEPLFVDGELALQDKLLTLKNVIARSGKNRVQVSGSASEPMNIKWSVDAQQLTQISPDIGGNIQGKGALQGSYKSPLIKANIKATALRFKETQLGKSPILANAEVQLQNGVPMVKNLAVNSGDNHIRISGRASSPFDLKWDIDGKNMEQFLPGLSGRLKAKGQLQGSIDNPVINADIEARNLRYQELKLASADFVARTSNGQYKITGNLKKLEASGKKISDAKLNASGRIENHVVDLSINYNVANANIKAKGGWINQRWQGVLQDFKYKNKNTGNWDLQKPVQITASKESFSASDFCLRNDKTRVCTRASWTQRGGLNAEGKLQKTPLALLKPWLPEGIELNGDVEGSYTLRQQNGHPKGSINIKLPDSSITFKTEDGDEQSFSYKDATLNATINDKKITSKVNMEIINRGHLSSNATINLSPKDGKHTIDGSAKLDVPNINWAQDFIPHSRGLRGALSSKFSFSGLLSKPRIVGSANLKNGYLRLPEAGTELTNINLKLRADKPGQAVIKGKMFMGKGALNVNGSMDIRNFAKWKAKLKISGNNIRFLNTHEVRATMTPDLTIDLTPNLVALKGKVVIPEASINLKDIPELSIDESGDTIVLGEKQKGERVSAVKVQPDVLIELGDRVKINAFGLKAKLSGNVNITHNRRDILSQGSLRVTEGKYQAYGQNLEINNGRLIFNGSPKLVGMDIRATRQVGDNLVGIHLGGTILKPKSKIFSDPTLPEGQALSLLLTGHDLDSVSGQEGALLTSAVHGLGVSGSDSLLHNIGSSLGLDDVNIVTKDDFKKSELALGKRLGPRIYVRYLVGLFDQAQKVAIDYKINKVLSLQAETSVENFGLDFIYKIERD